MSETVHRVPQDFARHAFINHAKYLEMYKQSVVDPDGFWREQAGRIDWITPFKRVKNTSFKLPNVSIKWFETIRNTPRRSRIVSCIARSAVSPTC